MVFYAALGMIVVSLVSMGFDGKSLFRTGNILTSDYVTLLGLILIGFGCTIAFFTLNQAIKMIDSVFVSFIRSSEIILAYIVQIILFHMTPSALGVIVSGCIITAIAIIPMEIKFNAVLPDRLKDIF